MDELIWVRRFFRSWPERIPAHLANTPFHRIAAHVDSTSLQPEQRLMKRVLDRTDAGDEEMELAQLWPVWAKFAESQSKGAYKKMRLACRHNRHRAEPFLMLGLAALLQEDRRTALKALRHAKRNDPRYPAIHDLLANFGRRKDPVLKFLDRQNPINVVLGKARHRLSTRT